MKIKIILLMFTIILLSGCQSWQDAFLMNNLTGEYLETFIGETLREAKEKCNTYRIEEFGDAAKNFSCVRGQYQ